MSVAKTDSPANSVRAERLHWPKLGLALAVGVAMSGSPAFAQSLDELIPQSAVERPEDWAAQGAPETPQPPAEDPQEPAEPDEQAPAPTVVPSDPLFDLNASLDNLSIPEIPELEPDPEALAFTEIDAPDLVELPDLIEVSLGEELVLAFPADRSLFPEEREFVERFRALSTIKALDSGQETVPQLAARARSDELLLDDILRNYGYYDGSVIRLLSGGRREQARVGSAVDSDPRVRFDIIPGERYSFGRIDLGALDRLPDPDGARLRSEFGIASGDPLYADRIVAQQLNLSVALGENGYPFATLGEPSLLVDHSRLEGDLTLPVEPGGKFVFGDILSNDPEFLSGRHLARIARFDPGEIYRESMKEDLRRAILATGLVSSVAIAPRKATPPEAGAPGKVALDVTLERAPLRTISGAIGYGTEDGFKLEAGWEHRNLFPPEGSLRLRGIIGTREQLASVTFARRNFRQRDQTIGIDAYASDIETEAVDARTIGLRAGLERVSNLIFQKPLGWQAGFELLYTDERNRVIGGIPRPRQTYQIAGLFGSMTIDRSDDLLDPTKGFRITGVVAPEVSRSLGDETYYVRTRIDASIYQPFGDNVIAGRIAFATNQGAEPFQLAPSRRLYAGGGGSVRGYGFQSIGPLNDFGEPTGGGSLVEAAVEARIETGLLDGAVEVVPFFDVGSVSLGSTPDFRFIQYGAGVGVRYKTSFGPIRVDVGVPLNPGMFDAPVVVYVSLGQAF